MANDLNQCNFIGRLGRDVEMRYMPSGDAIASFSIAVGWKSKDKEGAEWVSVNAFGKLAEICGEYLKKGSQVFISGRFKTDKYQDKEGNERYSVKIVADRMQMLGSRNFEPGATEDSAPESQPGTAVEKQPATGGTGFDDLADDIPF